MVVVLTPMGSNHTFHTTYSIIKSLTTDSYKKLFYKYFIILPFKIIGPASLLYTLYKLIRICIRFRNQTILKSIFDTILLSMKIWSVAEVIFYFYYLWRSHCLQKFTRAPPIPDPKKEFEKFLNSLPLIQKGVAISLRNKTIENESDFADDFCTSLSAQNTIGMTDAQIIEASEDLESFLRKCLYKNIQNQELINHLAHPTESQLIALKHVEIRGWFFGCKIEDLFHGNIEEWLAYSFFNTLSPLLKPDQKVILHELIKKLEVWAELKFQPGFNSEVKCMRVAIDPVPSEPRPLFFYVLTSGLFSLVSRVFYSYNGFNSGKSGSLRYWYRAPLVDNHEPPIVFCHGLGVGNMIYIRFFKLLASKFNRGIFIIEQPNIASSISEDVPSNVQLTACVKGMLEIWNYKNAHFIGHSFGTILLSWMCKLEPKCVYLCTFIDPVCFLLTKSDIVYNYMYRQQESPADMISEYLIARELHIAYSLSRNFHWHQNILWPEEINVPSLIILSGSDDIVPSATVQSFFAASSENRAKDLPIEMLIFEDLGHGYCMYVSSDATCEVAEAIYNFDSNFMNDDYSEISRRNSLKTPTRTNLTSGLKFQFISL